MNYSIATIGYKSFDNISRRVNEAYNSTHPPKEFVIVINPYGDSTETDKIIEFAKSDSRVTRWAILSQNIGCAKAFNLGFDLCKEECIFALSDDCSVGPETYGRMSSHFVDPKVGVVGVEAGHTSGDKYSAAKGFLLAYRRSMILEVGGYFEEFSPLACERELCLRCQHMGWSMVIDSNCEWSHVHDISNNPHHTIEYMGEKFTANEFISLMYPKVQSRIDVYNAK
tara:strand:+ start:3436 stop:4113 length:678 start_codon:yes stop_codon:yes gene_type:complete